MRIDPKGTVRGYSTLLIRQTLRRLRGDYEWGVEALENAAKLTPGSGRALKLASRADRVSRHGGWTVTQAGGPGGGHGGEAGDAARRKEPGQFLSVARVNDDPPWPG
jgi:hypothetical protein